MSVANNYVLFAANLEDFRALARKIIPEQIAHKFVQVISELSLKHAESHNMNRDSNSSSEFESNEVKRRIYLKGRDDNTTNNQHRKFTFEDLVRRVKKRLEEEFKMYHFPTTKKFITNINEIEEDNNVSSIITTKVKRTRKFRKRSKTYSTTTENTYIEEPRIEQHLVNNQLANEPPYERQLDGKLNEKQTVGGHKVKTEVKVHSVERQSFERKNFKKDVHGDKLKTKQARIDLNIKPINDAYNIRPKISYINHPIKPIKNKEKPVSIPDKLAKKDRNRKKLNKKQKEESSTNSLFVETYLGKKKDSYEDYIAPEKDANIYVSHETNYATKDTRFKIANNDFNAVKVTKASQVTKNIIVSLKFANYITEPTTEDIFDDDYTEKTVASDEIHARTERLWNSEDILRNDTDILDGDVKSVKKLATHVPKRDIYSVFTPGYVTNATLVVEKYDFNEPIPEKDRVREILTFLGDPVSQVNKKDRLF